MHHHMQHRVIRFHSLAYTWYHTWFEQLFLMLLAIVVFSGAVSASTRFEDRSLYMLSNEPGKTTSYTISFRYMSPVPVGSIDMLYCLSPIPYEDCVPPTGLDVSNAVLSNQTGETGYSIQTKTTNHIVLSRLPGIITANTPSTYTFDNIVNPTDTTTSFSIRLRTHSSTDATGPQIDFGSVKGQVQTGLTIETQVPPMLIFCVAEQVADNCAGTNDTYYRDMGQLNPDSTLTAQSQMAVGTNATGGFAITVNGIPFSAGTSTIDSPTTPTESRQGENQFGINLVANNIPAVGNDPEGIWANAIPAADYGVPNQYKYVPGDVVAYSPNVSLMRKFTVSYILNSGRDLRAGVYSTTITFIASGRF